MDEARLAELRQAYNRRTFTSAVDEYCPEEFAELLDEVAILRAQLRAVEEDRDYWKEVAEWADSDSFVLRTRPER